MACRDTLVDLLRLITMMSGFLETDSGTTNRLQNIIHLHTSVEHLQLGPWSYGSCAFSVPCFLYCFNKSWHQTSKQNIILNCQVIQNQRPFRWIVSMNFALGKRLNLSLHQYHVIHTCIDTYIYIYVCTFTCFFSSIIWGNFPAALHQERFAAPAAVTKTRSFKTMTHKPCKP